MVKIRLAKYGKKNDPFFRVVAIEHTNKNAGKALEVLGRWNPRLNEKTIDKKGIEAWVKKGAIVSDAVTKLMSDK